MALLNNNYEYHKLLKYIEGFIKKGSIKKLKTIYGGETGIRTLGGVTLNGFQGRRFRPLSHLSKKVVPRAGLEPARDQLPRDFKSLVSTNSTTQAKEMRNYI